MDPLLLTAAAAALLVALFLLGAPVFLAFLAVNGAGVALLLGERGFGLVVNSIFSTATTGTLTAIALFVLMGEILFRSGATEVLFEAVDRLIGRVIGRQFVLAGALSAVFGALSGSNMAVSAMMARTIWPGMARRGYDRRLSIGMILAGASLAPVIPPSVLVIIIATLANVSVAGLLIAGVIPGLLLAGLFIAYTLLRVRADPALAPAAEDAVARGSAGRALLSCAPFLLIVASVMGLILGGVATPSESAATGVVGAMATAAAFGRLRTAMLLQALRGAALITAMILVIMASSTLFSQLLAISGATGALTRGVAELGLHPAAMLLAMMALVFVFCMFVDQVAVMLVVIPIYLPIIDSAGYDPIWFWLLMLLNVTVGGITPPFGYAMFAFRGAAPDVAMDDLFRAAWPFVGLFLLGMALVALVPGLATWLPSML
jgi:tripartite ATP-independent transporter DctM subunit